MRGYYFITDARLSLAGNINDVTLAAAAGAPVVQYRSSGLCTREMFAEARALRQLCRQTRFLVNDRVDLALAVQADGVHLGQDDLPLAAARALLGANAIIGVTVHNLEEARAAELGGADYLGVSPIFATQTKTDAGAPAGIDLLQQLRRATRLPLVAIGGITLQNAPEVIRAGADCACAISAVVTRSDVKEAVEQFQRLFDPRTALRTG
jgi:thiamine-phosphate pyrophosphorylase